MTLPDSGGWYMSMIAIDANEYALEPGRFIARTDVRERFEKTAKVVPIAYRDAIPVVEHEL